MVTLQHHLKVWHITKVLHGGSGQYALRLHQALLAQGLDSNLLLLEGATQPRISELRKMESFFDKAITKVVRGTSHRLANRPFHSLLGRERYQSPIKINHGDIVHLHGLTGWMGVAGLEDLIPHGARVFWTLHDLWPLTGGCVVYRGCHRFSQSCARCPALRNGFAAWAGLELKMKERFVLKHSIQPVANSQWTAARILESRVFRGTASIPVIPPIVDDAFLRPSKQNLRKELGIAPETAVVCLGARSVTDKHKGIDRFLRALAARTGPYPPFDVLLFGEGEIAEIKGLRIHAMGKVLSTVQMASIYRSSDLYVSPSLMETFGMSIAETQACGTAVAGYLVGGVTDAIWPGDAENFVPVENVEALLAAVDKALLTSPNARLIAAEARSEWANKNFTATVVGAIQAEIYATAVRQSTNSNLQCI